MLGEVVEGDAVAGEMIAEAAGNALGDHTMPVRHDLRAGYWEEMHGEPGESRAPRERAAGPIDPQFPRRYQWLSRVRGDSMNNLVLSEAPAGVYDGDLVASVDAQAINYQPMQGDLVEAQHIRTIDDIREREISLRQVEIAPNGDVMLWSRSTSSRWKRPLKLPRADASPGDEDIAIQIIGKVLYIVRPL